MEQIAIEKSIGFYYKLFLHYYRVTILPITEKGIQTKKAVAVILTAR